MSALICGSFAYDTIMVFPDHFKNHILPDKVHMLNVSFLVPDMRRDFGGCAGNIAYNLKLLGGDPLPMATVGNDFEPYARWMDGYKISRKHIKEINSTYTGQAFITTDMDDNQITAFHPGAMSLSHENKVSDATGVSIGIVSPDGREGMIDHALQFAEANIPFIFDPGQGLPMFDGEDLLRFAEQATWITMNEPNVPAVLGSVLLVFPLLRRISASGQENNAIPWAFLVLGVTLGLMSLAGSLLALAAFALVFFLAFNLLEAAMPAVVSRLSGTTGRGQKMGLYTTFQFLGAFGGGMGGGWLLGFGGDVVTLSVAGLLCSVWAVTMLVWLKRI